MKVLGICGGNGVMLYPFRKYLVGNIEPRSIFYTKNQEQWHANFPNIPMVKTLRELELAKPDVLIGHPDCGHSSMLSYSRKKTLGVARENPSLQLYLEAVDFYRPKIFALENLPKLLSQYSREDFEALFLPYYLIFHECSVTAFGNSQPGRKRLIIIGLRKDITSKAMTRFKLPTSNSPVKTTGELLKGLKNTRGHAAEELGHIRESINEEITIYGGKKLTAAQIQKEWTTQRAKDKRWKVEDRKYTTAPGVYRNLADEPPATVRKGNREFNPEGLMMTPRERARIQGVPDEFKIVYHSDNPKYWINKGRVTVTKTPPMELANWLYRRIKSLKNYL